MENKIIAGLFALVVAFGLWTYVVNNVSKEDTMSLENVPVVFQNEGALENHGLIMTEGVGQTVDLTITGNRNELMKLHSGNVAVVVNLSQLYDAGRQSVSYTVHYPAEVNSSSFAYTADQNRISVYLENLLTVNVPLVVEYSGDPADGYRTFPETELLSNSTGKEISTVEVKGPASVVDKITQARITVDLEGMTQSIRNQPYTFTLCDSAGQPVDVPNVEQVTTDVPEVELSLTIQGYKYVPFQATVLAGKGATEDTSEIVFEPAGIMITGSDDALAQCEYISLGEIDLGEYLDDTVITMPINLPAGITSLTEEETVSVRISFPELATRTFTLTNIQAVNVPAGMIPRIISATVNVTVRGPADLVKKMTESAFTVTVNVGNLTIGNPDIVDPVVTINSSFRAVGLVSNGRVTVTLEEEPTEPPTDPPTEPDPQMEE